MNDETEPTRPITEGGYLVGSSFNPRRHERANEIKIYRAFHKPSRSKYERHQGSAEQVRRREQAL